MKKKNRENDGLFCTSVVLNYTSFLFPTQGRKKKNPPSFRYKVMTLSVCLCGCCAGTLALMALAGGIRKGPSDGNLNSVFCQDCLWLLILSGNLQTGSIYV